MTPLGNLAGAIGLVRARIERIARRLAEEVAPLFAELRHLNGICDNASSHREQVRSVKESLSRHGEGPNRCC